MKKLLFISLLSVLILGGNANLPAQNIETASRSGKIEEIKTCLAKGADPNFKWDKQTILAHSFSDKTLEIPKLLINTKGIKINEWNIDSQPEVSWKYTAIMKAVEFPEVLKLFIEKGALIDLQDDWLKFDGMPALSFWICYLDAKMCCLSLGFSIPVLCILRIFNPILN